jgi:hypothetical protein
MASCLKVMSSRMCDVGHAEPAPQPRCTPDTSAADAKPPLQRAPLAGTIIGPGPWIKSRTRHSNRSGRSVGVWHATHAPLMAQFSSCRFRRSKSDELALWTKTFKQTWHWPMRTKLFRLGSLSNRQKQLKWSIFNSKCLRTQFSLITVATTHTHTPAAFRRLVDGFMGFYSGTQISKRGEIRGDV